MFEFIKELKQDKYSAKTSESKPAEAAPTETAPATQPAAPEAQKEQQFTQENLVGILQDLASGSLPFQTAGGINILSAERVGAQASRFIKRLGGLEAAAKAIMPNINVNTFKTMNKDNQRYSVFVQLEKLGESGFGRFFTREAPGRLERALKREERRAKRRQG